MSAEAVTLNLPGSLYADLMQRARQRKRSLEAELLEVVESVLHPPSDLPPEITTALESLRELDDDALTRAARDAFPADAAEELEGLNHKTQREELSPAEARRREELLAGYERLVLLRAEAATLLQQRGHDVSDLLLGE